MLIFCNGCSQADYKKVDSFFGFTKPKSTRTLEQYQIGKDSVLGFEPFKVTPYDSQKVAQKSIEIKKAILSKKATPKKVYQKPIVDGWRKDKNLVRAYEEAKAFEKARRDLAEIYSGKKRLTTKDTTHDFISKPRR